MSFHKLQNPLKLQLISGEIKNAAIAVASGAILARAHSVACNKTVNTWHSRADAVALLQQRFLLLLYTVNATTTYRYAGEQRATQRRQTKNQVLPHCQCHRNVQATSASKFMN